MNDVLVTFDEMVMFLVFLAGNDESPVFTDAAHISRADKTEKRIMSVFGADDYEVYRAEVKRLYPSQSN